MQTKMDHLPPRINSLRLQQQKIRRDTVATAILLVVALALFVAHHPHFHQHRPVHPRPLCRCHRHPPHALVVCRRPPSWSCGRLVNALSPANTRLCQSRCWLIVVRLLLPSPSLPLLARHPRHHRSCRHRHRPLRRTPPSLPTPWPVLPSPSSSTSTLIAVTIALAILALFVTAITIRRTLSSYVVAHRRGRVVASSTPSCQPPPAFVVPVAG
jgi:hypothetical protein